MIDTIKGKRVEIWISFNLQGSTRVIEGVVENCSTLGGENFIVFEDGTMINTKYVQAIKIQ